MRTPARTTIVVVPFEDSVKKAFGLEGEVWLRHANPWSVYTRMPIPALLVQHAPP